MDLCSKATRGTKSIHPTISITHPKYIPFRGGVGLLSKTQVIKIVLEQCDNMYKFNISI